MSLLREVALIVVTAGGPIRLDKIAKLMPHATQLQVSTAAGNAVCRGLIHCARIETLPTGRIGVYAPGPKPNPEDLPRGDYGIPKVASVWELGAA